MTQLKIKQNSKVLLDKKRLSNMSNALVICQAYLLGCLVLIKLIKEAIRSKISTKERKRLK